MLTVLLVVALLSSAPSSTAPPQVDALLDVDDGDLSSLQAVKHKLGLQAWFHPQRKKRITTELPDSGGTSVTVVFKDGTWEPAKGNSPVPRNSPEVLGVEIRGTGSFTLPTDPRRLAVAMFAPRGMGPASRDGLPPAATVWVGDGGLYFYRHGAQWLLARYVGRAPFHVTEPERREIEDVLVAMRDAAARGETDLAQFMATHYTSQRDGTTPIYRFALATIDVRTPSLAQVDFQAPTPLPSLFGPDAMIDTHFAHDAGQIAQRIHLEGIDAFPSRYFFRNRDDVNEDQAGAAKNARFTQLMMVIPQSE